MNLEFLGITLLPVGGGKEKSVFEDFKKHSEAVVVTVRKFEEVIAAYSEEKYEKGEELRKEVDKLESKADRLGAKFEAGLSLGAFLPAFRGDLSRLSEKIDDVADMAEEAIRCVYLRPRVFEDLRKAERRNDEVKAIRVGLVELASKSVDCAGILHDTVSILMEDMDKAVEKAEEIHRHEGKSDIAEEKLIQELYKFEDLLPLLTVMQIKELIEMTAEISDTAEDAGDILSAMCVALKV